MPSAAFISVPLLRAASHSLATPSILGRRPTAPLPALPARRRAAPRAAASNPDTPADEKPTKMGPGDVVLVALPYNKFEVAQILGFDSSGRTADIVVLKRFMENTYIYQDGAIANKTYEKVANLYPLVHEYNDLQDGFDISPDAIAAAQRALSENRHAVVDTTAPSAAERETSATKKDYSGRFSFPTPTKKQALAGATLSVPMAAALFAGYWSMKETFERNPVGPDEALALFRKIAMVVSFGASGLTLMAGIGLFLWAMSRTD